MSGFVLTIILGPGLALVILLAMWLAAALGVDGFSTDCQRRTTAYQPPAPVHQEAARSRQQQVAA